MNKTNPTDTGAIKIDLNTKINEIKLNIMMWPAVMLANKRIINAKGFVKTPITSIGTMIGYKAKGTGGKKMCFQ